MALRILQIGNSASAAAILRDVGVDSAGISCMVPKMKHLNIRIPDVQCSAANIMKQDMLSLGADAAVARGSAACSLPMTDVILMGTEKQLQLAVLKFRKQPFGIREIAERLKQLLENVERSSFKIRYRRGVLNLGERTHIMGILNVTPDSFSDGGRYLDTERALDRALEMVDEGADIIDIGGESTRPGASPVPAAGEMDRIIPVIEKLAGRITPPISVDTCKADVARRALDSGADIVNDISGLRFDRDMPYVIAEAGCPVILMHIKGTPADMQTKPAYESLMNEIIEYLESSINLAAEADIDPDKVIVDPGIGFGKSLEDNLKIINKLGELKVLGKAVLVGPSRKSFIGSILNSETDERLEGTIAASVLAVARGTHIVRVHDVKEARRALKVADAIKRFN